MTIEEAIQRAKRLGQARLQTAGARSQCACFDGSARAPEAVDGAPDSAAVPLEPLSTVEISHSGLRAESGAC